VRTGAAATRAITGYSRDIASCVHESAIACCRETWIFYVVAEIRRYYSRLRTFLRVYDMLQVSVAVVEAGYCILKKIVVIYFGFVNE
jgi:hypothetical protein